MPWFNDFLQSRGIVGDPPPKRPKRAAADATYVAPPRIPELPKIGPLQPQNMAAGGGIDQSRDAYQPLPSEDQGVFGSGEGQGVFDVLPGVGSARGVKAGIDLSKQSLPLGLLVGGLSALPEGGALAGKVGRALGKELPYLGKPLAAIRVHVPGEAEPRLFTGHIHPMARNDAEDQLGDLLDDNFEPKYQIDEGFVVGPDQTWLDRKQALDYAKRHKQLGGSSKSLENVKRSKQLKAEALKSSNGYDDADEIPSALADSVGMRGLRQPSRKEELEKLYGSDDALGVKYDEDLEMSVLPNGESATTCTNCAREIVKRHGGGRVVGYADKSNPTQGATGTFPGSGHDFAILDDRYIVDPWVKETSGTSRRAVFDMKDPADQAEIARLYGEPRKWVQVQGPKDNPIPLPMGFNAADRAATPARIAASSVKMPDGKIFTGRHHADALEAAGRTGRYAKYLKRGVDEDGNEFFNMTQAGVAEVWPNTGFVDADGVHLSREDAAARAKQHGQLTGVDRPTESGSYKLGELDGPVTPPEKDEPPAALTDSLFAAPAIHVKDEWKPTERGVFDRSAPKLQGTAEPDPRLFASMPRGKASPLAEAISESPVVEGGLFDDALRGLPRGGKEWYELGPLWQYFQEHGGEQNFWDWLHASGAGSVQNPTHNELATASGLLFGKKRGIDWEMVKQIQQQMHPKEKKLWLGEDISKIFNRATDEGILLPESPSASTRKVPWYTQGKAGGSARSLPALDTHERRRITQLAAQDDNIRKMLEVLQVKEKGKPPRPFRLQGTNADVIPIGNGLDYEALARPYMRGANLLDLPSSQSFQAGRWLGGGEHTGLLSAPFGDYVQTLEDGLLYTARLRGLDESPAGLRRLAGSIFSGDEMFAPVYSRKGGFPGVTGH